MFGNGSRREQSTSCPLHHGSVGQRQSGSAPDFLSPGYARHTSPTLPPLDLEGQIERLHGFRQAFPDITIEVDDVMVEGDCIAFRSTMRGTHKGEFAGIPPTGRHVTAGLVDMIRIEDGRFAEQWGGPDVFDMLQQLGARPTSGD